MIARLLYDISKRSSSSLIFRLVLQTLSCTPLTGFLTSLVLGYLPLGSRIAALRFIMSQVRRPLPIWMTLSGAYWTYRALRSDRSASAFWLLASVANHHSPHLRARWETQFADDLRKYPKSAGLHIALAQLHYVDGNYAEAARSYDAAHSIDPDCLASGAIGLDAAHASGRMLNTARSMSHFGIHFGIVVDPFEELGGEVAERTVSNRLLEDSTDVLVPRLVLDAVANETLEKYGVFLHSSTVALGHAVLDPYHFLALRRNRFDRIYFVGPGRKQYRPASAVCLKFLESEGRYVETQNEMLLNASWMHFGAIKHGNVEVCVDHYWSLLREVVHRTRDLDDAFQHNAWHLTLPAAIENRGRAFAETVGIDLERPLVVLHVRHDAYHRLEAQAFRNVNADQYVRAIRYLLDHDYQVVRLGEETMPRMPIANDGYTELPLHPGYRHELDPFFIAHSDFMIGCQSGPCAYARSMGVPLLSVNAVLHYSLLPAPMEMACFKRYERRSGNGWTPMTLEEALAANAQHFEISHQFSEANIRVIESDEEEILAATLDMIEWLKNPKAPLTSAQTAFQEQVEEKCVELETGRAAIDNPIADYLGVALPGYRLSPTVADLRA